MCICGSVAPQDAWRKSEQHSSDREAGSGAVGPTLPLMVRQGNQHRDRQAKALLTQSVCNVAVKKTSQYADFDCLHIV